jgi:hypothetical protein
MVDSLSRAVAADAMLNREERILFNTGCTTAYYTGRTTWKLLRWAEEETAIAVGSGT